MDDIGPWDIRYQRVQRLAEGASGMQAVFNIQKNITLTQYPKSHLGEYKDLYIEAYLRDNKD